MDDDARHRALAHRAGLLVARRGAAATATSRSTCGAARARRPGRARAARRGRGRELLSGDRVGFGRWFYANTQSRIHVIVTHGVPALARAARPRRVARSAASRRACRRRGPARRREREARPGSALGSSAVALAGDRAQLAAVVRRVRRGAPCRERERMTSDSVVAPCVALVAHALQHVAVGHAGGGEEAVVGARRGRPA